MNQHIITNIRIFKGARWRGGRASDSESRSLNCFRVHYFFFLYVDPYVEVVIVVYSNEVIWVRYNIGYLSQKFRNTYTCSIISFTSFLT